MSNGSNPGTITLYPITTGTTTGCLPAHIWADLGTSQHCWVTGPDQHRSVAWHQNLTTAGHHCHHHTDPTTDPETFTTTVLTATTPDTHTVILWIGNNPGHLVAAFGHATAMNPEATTITTKPTTGTETGADLIDFVDVVNRILSPGGCPWALEQNHHTLAEYALEETHELLHAIHTNNHTELREELGDVLLQIFWHARLAQTHPTNPFTIDDVAATIAHKMRTRRPHIFAGDTTSAAATNIEATDAQWNAIKKAEKQRDSCLDGIAPTLPALLKTAKTLHRADKANLLNDALGGGVAQEVSVPRDGVAAGDYLVAVVHALQSAGISAEIVLAEALIRVEDRIKAAEGA